MPRHGRWLGGFAGIAGLALAIPAVAGDERLTLDQAATTITFTLAATAHTVEGTLALDSGVVVFNAESGRASGAIVVRLAGASTGNERRDRKMHDDILETATYPIATFRPERVIGSPRDGVPSTIAVHGVLSFHGGEHPLTLEVRVDRRGNRVTAEADIPIPYVDWGLEDPSVFVLRVAKVVDVHVKTDGRIEPQPS